MMVENEELHDGNIYAETERDGLVRMITKVEGMGILDKGARRYSDMSGEEFIHAWESGQFDDDPDGPNVMYVALLIPLAK
jgi:hypothetical protein